MKHLLAAVLYLAAAVCANAGPPDLEAMREGDMRKLNFHDAPREVPDVELTGLDGETRALSDLRGRWVVVNFWATWCPPCRKEMPALDALSAEMADEGLSVVAIAYGRNPVPGIERFLSEAGVEGLPVWRDPQRKLGAPMGVFGLPTTVVIDPEGREVARLQGEADWNSPEAQALLRALIGG